jgi:uncharacterized membrane protein
MGKCGPSKEANSCCCGGDEEVADKAARETKSPVTEILEERFARGEIDEAEFEERRQVLAAVR